MGRALVAVGAALALAFAVLGLVVFVTRDEDSVAIDNLLSETLTRAFGTAQERGEDVDLGQVADFGWDRVLIVEPGTSRAEISATLGTEYRGIERFDAGDLILFARGPRMVRYADYRGRGRFEGIERPVAELSREEAVFRVRGLVFRPVDDAGS